MTRRQPPPPYVASSALDLIGESPVWSGREQVLYRVDVEGRSVHRFDPSTGTSQSWPLPEPIGSIGLRAAGGLVGATRSGFVFIDTLTGSVDPIADPERDIPGNRFNDGKVDRLGRFFAGTKNIANTTAPTGTLYRLDADRSVHAVHRGISCTNGIAWSPDDRVMYLCDTWLRRILAFDYDRATGSATSPRLFAELDGAEGYPDGLTVDAEGTLWNAHYDGARITRYDPDGRVMTVVPMPVRHVTSLTFGGADLQTLYVTTARARLSAEALAAQPDAGSVFAFEPGVSGLPEPEFLG